MAIKLPPPTPTPKIVEPPPPPLPSLVGAVPPPAPPAPPPPSAIEGGFIPPLPPPQPILAPMVDDEALRQEATRLLGVPSATQIDRIETPEYQSVEALVRSLYPEKYGGLVRPGIDIGAGMVQPNVTVTALRDVLTQAQDEPEAFIRGLYTKGWNQNTERLLRLMGLDEVAVSEIFTGLSGEAQLMGLVNAVWTKGQFDNIADFTDFAEKRPDLVVRQVQTGPVIPQKGELLRNLGYSWDDIGKILSIVRLQAPVDGVQTQIAWDTTTNRAYDNSNKWVGIFNPVTNEFAEMPDEGIAKDTLDAIRMGVAGAGLGVRQFVNVVLPNAIWRDVQPARGRNAEEQANMDAWAAGVNKNNKQLRDKFRAIYGRQHNEYEEWVTKHPDLQSQRWLTGLIESVPLMLAAIGTTATGVALGQPGLGVLGGLAVMTPAVSSDVYNDLLAAGAEEGEAANLALSVGGLISATEVIAKIPYLRNVTPHVLALFRKKASQEVANAVVGSIAKQAAKTGIRTGIQITGIESLEEMVQQGMQNAAVKFYDENRSLLEGVAQAGLGAAVITAPLAIFGGGAVAINMMRVAPSRTVGLTESQMKAKGWVQDPKTPGNWYEAIKAMGREALVSEAGGIQIGPEGKPQIWQLTRNELIAEFRRTGNQQDLTNISAIHQASIKEAAAAGKPISAEVLKDYPALAKTIKVAPIGKPVAPAIPPAAIPEVGVKEPWQMTQAEFDAAIPVRASADPNQWIVKAEGLPQLRGDYKLGEAPSQTARKRFVKMALSEGKPVPAEVLKDYPDLAKAVPRVEPAVPAGQAKVIPERVAGAVVPPTAPPAQAAVKAKGSLIDQAERIHSELEADINITRKRIADIKTPSWAFGADVQFARLALNDANKLIRRSETLTRRMKQGQEVSEEEIAALQDKIRSLKDFYKYESKTTAEVKQKLVDYIKTQLPLPRQGELLAKVKNVKTEAQLTEAIARVAELAEAQAEKTLRADIIRELKKTAPRVEKGITVGKLTPEIQSVVDKLRASLLIGIKGEGGIARNVEAYETAQAQISQNVTDYQQGKITWDALLERNDELKYTGLYGMSTAQLQDSLDYIQELKRLGKDLRKIKREEIKAQRKEVVDKAVIEVTGGEGIKPGVGTLRGKDLAGIKKVLDQPVNSQYGFVNLLDKLGKFAKGTKQYAGFLMRFANLTQRAVNAENVGREQTFRQVRDKFREIYHVSKTREATRLLNALSNEDVDLGSFKIITDEGVRYLDIKLTRAEMMEAYQLYKNPKNLETFKEGMRWTPEIMTKIVAMLTEQDIAWADWLQNEFYSSYYDKINPFYREEFNIDMSKNPDYVPQSRDFEAKIDEADEIRMLLQDQTRYASVTNKSLKARQENIRPFKFKGVFTVLTNHIIQMEHFMAWAETMHELRSTFGNNEVRTAIRQYHSNDILKRFDDYMNDFARGGVDRAQFLNTLDKLRSNFAVSVLAIKPSIGLQQIWTVGAFMTEMKVKDFVTGWVGFFRSPIANYQWMMENSVYLKNRYSGGNYERDIRLSQQQGVAKTISGAANFSKYLLWQVTQGDKFGVMPGWWAKYQAGLKEGLPQADAMVEADLASERTQNTSELASLSWLQRGTSWGKLLTMFQSQPNKYFRIIADNIRNMQYGRQSKVKGITNLFIVWVLLPALFQFVGDAFKWKKEKQARVLLLGPLNNILVAGQLVQTAWGWFTDDSFDWQASPVLSTVRDFQNFSSKLVKIIRQIKDPYEDVVMDDIVAAIEFFSKGIGQVVGAPTPYLIMVERAIRDGDPRELVFSRWALEEPKLDLKGKTSKLVGQLGQVVEDITDLPVDKKPPVYDTKKAFSGVKQALGKTLPSDVTEKNGFDPVVVSIAQAIMDQNILETLPNKRLFEIIDNIESDNTLNYTFSQYFMDYQDRAKITSLAELKDWDAEHPRYNLGNVTPEQFALMRQYEALDKDKRKEFLKTHPELKIDPRDEWLKSHPEENARLAIWGQAKLMTPEALAEVQQLVKELDIPQNALADFVLPPEHSVKGYAELIKAREEFGDTSVEVKLLLAKDDELRKFMGWQPIDTPIAALELKVKNRKLSDQYDALGDPESETYVFDNTEREKARADLKKVNPLWVDDLRRIEAIENKAIGYLKTLPLPTQPKGDEWILRPSEIEFPGREALKTQTQIKQAESWARGLTASQYDQVIREWIEDHPSETRELLEQGKRFVGFGWITDPMQFVRLEMADVIGFQVLGLSSEKAHELTDRRFPGLRGRFAQDQKGEDPLVESWVEHGREADKYPGYSAEEKLWLADHPDVHKWALDNKLTTDNGSDWNIPVLRITVQYRDQFDELEGNATFGSPYYIEDPVARAVADDALKFTTTTKTYAGMTFTTKALTEFGEAYYRRQAYGELIPDNYIADALGWKRLGAEGKPTEWKAKTGTDKWYEDDWYMMEHQPFYKEVYIAQQHHDRLDFTKVPSRPVFKDYLGYVAMPDSGTGSLTAKRDYRRAHPDLDYWMVNILGYAPLSGSTSSGTTGSTGGVGAPIIP